MSDGPSPSTAAPSTGARFSAEWTPVEIDYVDAITTEGHRVLRPDRVRDGAADRWLQPLRQTAVKLGDAAADHDVHR